MQLPESPRRDGHVQQGKKPSRLPWLIVLAILAFACIPLYFMWKAGNVGEQTLQMQKPSPTATSPVAKVTVPPPPPPSKQGPVIDVKTAEKQPPGGEQAQRREQFGLDKSVDVVVRSDETIKVGDKEISVSEVERKLSVQSRGEMIERKAGQPEEISAWGFHLVRSDENLWNIHFHLLREYLSARGISLQPNADEPTEMGYSSGIGRTLKFAEHMVGVYNIQTGHMSRDLNTLDPGQKLVVFNLSELFGQLAKVDPAELAKVRFDGRTLFLPVDGAQDIVGEGQKPSTPADH